jgi:ABC-2 type transport system permease protein
MNIYKHELKMSLGSVISWSVALIILIFVVMSLFSGMAADAELLNEAMDQFPPELMAAFGMTGIDLATVLGFYSLIFLFIQICLAIQAANYGFGLVSIEERELTADFLMAKPVGRSKILTSKLLSAGTGLVITHIVVWITTLVAINIFRDGRAYDTTALLLLLLSIALFQLFFLSVGMLISLLVKRVRSVTSFSMGLVFGMYFLNAFGNMLGKETFELISPFKHFDANYIITHVGYDLPLVLLSVIVVVISIAGSYLLYARRNIASAV